MGGVLLGVVARVPPEGVAAFAEYESRVLPLLADHGGVLERRTRTADGTVEIHLVRFASEAGFAAYRDDPRRAAHAALLERSGARTELFRMDDAGV